MKKLILLLIVPAKVQMDLVRIRANVATRDLQERGQSPMTSSIDQKLALLNLLLYFNQLQVAIIFKASLSSSNNLLFSIIKFFFAFLYILLSCLPCCCCCVVVVVAICDVTQCSSRKDQLNIPTTTLSQKYRLY